MVETGQSLEEYVALRNVNKLVRTEIKNKDFKDRSPLSTQYEIVEKSELTSEMPVENDLIQDLDFARH